jgi:hypothetical protein
MKMQGPYNRPESLIEAPCIEHEAQSAERTLKLLDVMGPCMSGVAYKRKSCAEYCSYVKSKMCALCLKYRLLVRHCQWREALPRI